MARCASGMHRVPTLPNRENNNFRSWGHSVYYSFHHDSFCASLATSPSLSLREASHGRLRTHVGDRWCLSEFSMAQTQCFRPKRKNLDGNFSIPWIQGVRECNGFFFLRREELLRQHVATRREVASLELAGFGITFSANGQTLAAWDGGCSFCLLRAPRMNRK